MVPLIEPLNLRELEVPTIKDHKASLKGQFGGFRIQGLGFDGFSFA